MKKSSSKRFIYMKKIFTIRYAMTAMTAVALIATMATTSCTKTEELSGGKEKITTLDASLDGGTKAEGVTGYEEIDLASGASTKVTLTDNASTTGKMGVVWKTGDAFYVFDGPSASSVPSKFTLTDGSATTSAKFSGTFSSTNGNQLYAIYAPWAPQETKPANWVANGHVVELIGVEAGGSFTTPMKNSSLGNYSIMYGGVKYTSGSIPKITFKNALVAIKITFPATGGFRYVRACSADGSMCNTATMKLYGGGTDGKSPDISWHNKGMYGTRQLWNQTTDANFAQFTTFYFLMLPQTTTTNAFVQVKSIYCSSLFIPKNASLIAFINSGESSLEPVSSVPFLETSSSYSFILVISGSIFVKANILPGSTFSLLSISYSIETINFRAKLYSSSWNICFDSKYCFRLLSQEYSSFQLRIDFSCTLS